MSIRLLPSRSPNTLALDHSRIFFRGEIYYPLKENFKNLGTPGVSETIDTEFLSTHGDLVFSEGSLYFNPSFTATAFSTYFRIKIWNPLYQACTISLESWFPVTTNRRTMYTLGINVTHSWSAYAMYVTSEQQKTPKRREWTSPNGEYYDADHLDETWHTEKMQMNASGFSVTYDGVTSPFRAWNAKLGTNPFLYLCFQSMDTAVVTGTFRLKKLQIQKGLK